MNLDNLIYKLKQLPQHGAGEGSGPGESTEEFTIFTNSAILAENNSITIRGNITAKAGFKGSLQDKGFRFGISSNNLNNAYTASSATSFGQYSVGISNLEPGRIYYFTSQARTAPKVAGGVPGLYKTGSTVQIINKPTFQYDTSKGPDSLELTSIKNIFDSKQSNTNVSLRTLSRLAGLNKTADISFFDFKDHQMEVQGPFYHATSCGDTASSQHWRSNNVNGTPSGFFYNVESNGRVNFMPNGNIFLSTSDITDPTKTNTINQVAISNGSAASSTICTPAQSS